MSNGIFKITFIRYAFDKKVQMPNISNDLRALKNAKQPNHPKSTLTS